MVFFSPSPSTFQVVCAGLAIFPLFSGVHSLDVDTPNNISGCETMKLSWNGEQPPFSLYILFQQNNSIVHEFDNINNTSLFWQAAVPAGAALYLELSDSSPNNYPSYSGNFQVLPGSDACLQSSTVTSSSTGTGIISHLCTKHWHHANHPSTSVVTNPESSNSRNP